MQPDEIEEEPDLKTQALEVIQFMTRILDEDDIGPLSFLFMVAHVALGTCNEDHHSWKKGIRQIYREIKGQDGEVPEIVKELVESMQKLTQPDIPTTMLEKQTNTFAGRYNIGQQPGLTTR